ncbi:MAG: peptidase [Gemmataceae bacterium]|mgnify:CR=1 FL=1
MKVLVLVADGFEDIELFYPYFRCLEEGAEAVLASPGGGKVTGRHGYVVETRLPIHEANPAEYQVLLLPGGDAPERLRLREEAVDITRTFVEEDRPVAAIGYGPQLLISAGVLFGRYATCAPGIRDDLRAAGANYRDEPCVVDGNLITARGFNDLPHFCREMLGRFLARARQ